MVKRLINPFLWGNSIALSWMWGLGLFFSVQITYLFGLFGLLSFAIPNALGLLIYGYILQRVANRKPGPESLSEFYAQWSRPFRLVFFLYQVLALMLTIFAIIRYLWEPLGLEPFLLYLPLTLLVVLAAASLFGEEFDITRIKFSHLSLGLIMLVAIGILFFHIDFDDIQKQGWISFEPIKDMGYWGYVIPLCIGLLLGPWLDLQQWQRAIQIRREKASIFQSYVIGATCFFLLLLFHGLLTWWVVGTRTGISELSQIGILKGIDLYSYAQGINTAFFYNHEYLRDLVFPAYCAFICICILTTLDSGYIALKWFLSSNAKASKHMIFSIVPEWIVSSPIPTLIFCGFFTIFAVIAKFQLEYYMIFYATFFVGYEALAVSRCYSAKPTIPLPQIKLFCVGSVAVVVFSYGYFQETPAAQIIGALMPLIYVLWLLLKPGADEELDLPTVIKEEATSLIKQVKEGVTGSGDKTKIVEVVKGSGGYFEDNHWFVYKVLATYVDTNSVGNIYFAMYPVWVGKARELFFNKVLPNFDLNNTDYFILTRSFEHKFTKEAKEFDEITIKIRISENNRKFAMLEHRIYDAQNDLLGKGNQSLMFVDSSNYKLIDIPREVYKAFSPHI
ncbi:MAG: thioesterase family protein [Verrucomicrobiota bacterium]